MKHIIKFAGIVTALLLITEAGFAQDGSLKIGGGLTYGTGVFEGDTSVDNDLGLRVDGVYTIDEEFRAVADFTFYFPKEESGLKVTVWELNANGNYLFLSEDELILYGLAGLNITGISSTVDAGELGSFSGSDSEVGLNIGGGLEYGLDFGAFFTEIKYVISSADQLAISAGLRFDI